MGHAGMVMGLEVSRLARNNADRHRLLEICALSDTLILDEDGVYDPASFNDRLLLGLKGTMSEAELHVLKARLRGGILNKVRRGEYRCVLPTGLVYDESGAVVLDPDAQVRETIAHFFDTFVRVGSAHQTVKAFRDEGLRFPSRLRAPAAGVVFRPLTASPTPTLATSAGTDTRRTSGSSRRTATGTTSRAHPRRAKAAHSSRGAPSAGDAGSIFGCATGRRAGSSSLGTSATAPPIPAPSQTASRWQAPRSTKRSGSWWRRR